MIEFHHVAEEPNYIKLLLYGPPGVGKTTLAATLDPEHTLFVNIEGGMLSVADTEAKTTKQLRTVDEVEEVFWALAHGNKEFDWVKVVVLDSGTELQTIDLEGIVAEARKQNKNRKLEDIHIEDYGKSTARLKRVFRQFRDLPCHTVITCLSKTIMSEGKNKRPVAIVPMLTDKLSQSLMGYMDYVWYLDVTPEGERAIATQNTGLVKAKTRGNRFSKEIGKLVREPNLNELNNILIETEGKK